MEDVQVGDTVEYRCGKSTREGKVIAVKASTIVVEHDPIPLMDTELVPLAHVHKSKVVRKGDA